MGEINGELIVFFDEPYWIGTVERIEDGKLSVAKIMFGGEPKDYEVYDFVLKHYDELKFSPSVKADVKEHSKNPKKIQREISKQLQSKGIGTKSQQALKLQQEEHKLERKAISRERKEAEAKLQFEKRQKKKKEKHRGH